MDDFKFIYLFEALFMLVTFKWRHGYIISDYLLFISFIIIKRDIIWSRTSLSPRTNKQLRLLFLGSNDGRLTFIEHHWLSLFPNDLIVSSQSSIMSNTFDSHKLCQIQSKFQQKIPIFNSKNHKIVCLT